MVKHYVYAFDATALHIIAAISCPDEQAAKRVYQAAKNEIKETKCQFQYGYASVDVHQTVPLKGNNRNGRQPEALFDADDFESAEVQTREILCEETVAFKFWYIEESIVFMRHVQTALSEFYFHFHPQGVVSEWKKEQSNESVIGKQLMQIEQSQVIAEPAMQLTNAVRPESTPEPEVKLEDPADTVDRLLAEGKGRWVSQNDFLEDRKRANPRGFLWKKVLKALRRSREADRMKVWSKKNPRIGQDENDNILKYKGNRDNKQSIRYMYFLENESGKTVAQSASQSHSAPPLQ